MRPGAPAQIDLANGDRCGGDLVIGADGLHSAVRGALNGAVAPVFTRQVAWRAVVPNLAGHPPEARVHMGPGRHLVSYPLRGGAQGQQQQQKRRRSPSHVQRSLTRKSGGPRLSTLVLPP